MHNSPLYEYLYEEISSSKKPKPLSEVMALALYDKQYGYYSNRFPFGKDGDFITSPLVSQMFGEILCAYIANFIINNHYKDITLVELGPGDGSLIYDILRVMPEGLVSKVILIENSEYLTNIQKRKLQQFSYISWCKNIDEISNIQNEVVFIANEFFDALPIRQFTKYQGIFYENYLGIKDNRLEIIPYDKNHGMEFNLDLPENSIIEYNQYGIEILGKICDILKTFKGLSLIIDYGYINNEKYISSLQSVKDNKYVEILPNLGIADITSHIDFGLMAKYVSEQNLQYFITTQGEFLLSNGITTRAKALFARNPNKIEIINNQLHRLTHKDKMGEIFKILGFCKI